MHRLLPPSAWRSAPHALCEQWGAEETAQLPPVMKQHWRSAAAADAAAVAAAVVAAVGLNLQFQEPVKGPV